MATRDGTFTIIQISDLHCGTQFFLPNLLERLALPVPPPAAAEGRP